MNETLTVLKGIVHGKTIELEQEPGLPEGQVVSVTVQPVVPEARTMAPGEGIRALRVDGLKTPKNLMNTWNWCVNSAKSVALSLSRELPPRHGHVFGPSQECPNRDQQVSSVHRQTAHVGHYLGRTLRVGASGQAPPRRKQSLLDLLNDTKALIVDDDVARRFGEEQAMLFDAGLRARPGSVHRQHGPCARSISPARKFRILAHTNPTRERGL